MSVNENMPQLQTKKPSINLWGIQQAVNTGTSVPLIKERTPDSSEVINNTTSGKNKTVLLQIARTFASNEDGTKSTLVRIIFDNGSQHSYVTNNLELELKFEALQDQDIAFEHFQGAKL